MKLEEILAAWDEDSKIDSTELGEEARKIPRLHAKYLRWLSTEKMTLRSLESEYRRFRFEKQQYYIEGPENIQEYEEKQKLWKTVPNRQRTVLRTAVDDHLDADIDVDTLRLKKELCQTKIEALEMIMSEIMYRNNKISSMIQWEQWKGGGK